MKPRLDYGSWKFLKAIVVCTAFFFTQQALSLTPVPADFQSILRTRVNTVTVWQYTDNPQVYVFDFPGLTQQGRSFNRVTQLTEQQLQEPYPKALNNEELGKYLEAARRSMADFAFGHDVLVHEFVTFFNLARKDKVDLNPEEYAIRDFLIEQGMIDEWRDTYRALKPNVVILSIPQAQEKNAGEPRINLPARATILMHELSHGEYYTNTYYRAFCQKFWAQTLTDSQRQAFEAFLSSNNYSLFDDLLVNEMQAYLMFTPDPASFSARRLGVSQEDLDKMREAFRSARPPTRLPLRFNPGDLK